MKFDGISTGIVQRLEPLFVHYRAKPTYLLSPEVVRHAPSAEALASLAGAHELGTHLHGEYAGDERATAPVTLAYQRDYPVEVERRKLQLLTEQFQVSFGYRPRSFRAGRFGIGANSIGLLERLGYVVESSVTPFVDWTSQGSKGLSFVGSPTQPYKPDRTSPGKPGESALLEVPVTILPHEYEGVPIVGRFLQARWLRPSFETEQGLIQIAIREIERARRAKPMGAILLNAMFHNVEVVPGASPYARTERQVQRIIDRLAGLLRFAERQDIACVGLSDVPGLFP
jgi:hypothetical protein